MKQKSILLLCVLFSTLSACGRPKAELEPGQKLGHILDSYEKVEEDVQKESEQTKAQELKDRQKKEALEALKKTPRSGPVTLELEKEGFDEEALYLSTPVFRLRELPQVEITTKNSRLYFALPGETSPIIITSKYFELQQNEVLQTKGRDLYIIAERVLLNGEIQTSPQQANSDEPGRSAGNLYISTVLLEAGKQARIDTRGGKAGDIHLRPQTEASGRRAQELQNQLQTELLRTEQEKTAARTPKATKEDAALLMDAWEKARSQLGHLDVQKLEQTLYPKELHFVRDDGSVQAIKLDLRSPQKRQSSLRKHRDLLIKRWQIFIENMPKSIKRGGVYAKYPLIPGKLYAQIQTLREFEIARSKTVYRDRVAYQHLSNGKAGDIEILSAFEVPEIELLQESKSQKFSPRPVSLLSNLPAKNKSIASYEAHHQIIHFFAKQDEIETQTNVLIEGSRKLRKRIALEFKASDEPVESIPHPNDLRETPPAARYHLIEDPEKLTRLLERWRVLREIPDVYQKIAELFKAPNEP